MPAIHLQLGSAKKQLAAYEEHIAELERYLASPKFKTDTTVQISDVQLRLHEMKREVWKHEL